MNDLKLYEDPRVTPDTSFAAVQLTKFSAMEDTVNEICRSLQEEPLKWVFETYTFYRNYGPKIEYWHNSNCVTEIWRHGTHKVFSQEQGYRIAAAVKIARLYQQDENQHMIMRAMGTAPIDPLTNKKDASQPVKSNSGFFASFKKIFWN